MIIPIDYNSKHNILKKISMLLFLNTQCCPGHLLKREHPVFLITSMIKQQEMVDQ